MAPFKPGPDLLAGPMGRRGGLGPQTMSLRTEGKPPPPKAPRGVRVEHRIGVQAPADVVWDIVYDLGRWNEWNPTYPQAAGEVRIGNVLTLAVRSGLVDGGRNDGIEFSQAQPVFGG